MSPVKRFAPFLVCIAGLLVLLLAQRLFDRVQPRHVNVTREKALATADREAQKLGVDLSRAWRVVTWEDGGILEREYASDAALRRRASADPVVSERLGSYYVVYFRRGVEKYPPWADVYVSARNGQVLGARTRARNEAAGGSPTDAQLRAKADAVIASLPLPGGVRPVFESARPAVFRNRTDWTFRYRVPDTFPTGNVALYVNVYFTGSEFSGFLPIEEYRDGSAYRGEGLAVATQFIRFATIFALLLVLLILFLKKYHAGEVGVGTASVLFAASVLLSFATNLLMVPALSVGTQFGSGIDAPQTAIAMGMFKFLFYDLPISVLVFFGWSVGESYARERWGQRLASFDSILRRDPLNATVGRSVLTGLLCAPAVAAAAYAVAAIPVGLGFARPTVPAATNLILGAGGPLAALFNSAYESLLGTVAMVLFIVAFFARKRLLPAGLVLASVAGTLAGLNEVPVSPALQQIIFGFGATLAAALVFLSFDLLAAGTALFLGSMIFGFVPYLRFASGDAATMPSLTLALPLAGTLVFAIAALLTRREVEYTADDLAPHVRRIIERERVKAEIDAANRIQAALLPLDTPNLAGASVSSHYRAATEIGGDYFDFLPQATGEIGIAFGDVSGHGLTSGIVMAMAKSALLVQVGYDPSPRAVLDVLNDIVIRTAPRRILMTFFFGLLDPVSQTLRFSSAGHHDPYVYRAATGKLEPLSSWGFPLGVKRRDPFREHTVEFSAGDKLILYSDGLIEAVDDHGEPFGFDRFEQTLATHGDDSADDMKKAILTAVRKFTHNRPPEDDQTLVVVAFDEVPAGAVATPRFVASAASETVH